MWTRLSTEIGHELHAPGGVAALACLSAPADDEQHADEHLAGADRMARAALACSQVYQAGVLGQRQTIMLMVRHSNGGSTSCCTQRLCCSVHRALSWMPLFLLRT